MHAPGSRSARPLAVQVTDETGKPIPEASGSFHLPDAHGRASLRGLQVNRNSGRFQVRIVASREQARAGTVSFQYIAEPNSGAASPNRPAPRKAESGGHGKWAVVAAIAGGGAVAGLLAARSGRTPATAAVPPPAVIPTLTVGIPTVTVGKP